MRMTRKAPWKIIVFPGYEDVNNKIKILQAKMIRTARAMVREKLIFKGVPRLSKVRAEFNNKVTS